MRLYEFAEPEQLDEINWKQVKKQAQAAALAGAVAASPMAAQADYSGAEPSAMETTSIGYAVAQAGNEFHVIPDKDAIAFRFSNHVVPYGVGNQTATLHFPGGQIIQKNYNRGKDAGEMWIKDAQLAEYMQHYNGKFMVSFGNNGQSAVFNIASK